MRVCQERNVSSKSNITQNSVLYTHHINSYFIYFHFFIWKYKFEEHSMLIGYAPSETAIKHILLRLC